MKVYKIISLSFITSLILTSCFGGKLTGSQQGGEVTGVGSGRGFQEPTPYGMTLVNRGFLHFFDPAHAMNPINHKLTQLKHGKKPPLDKLS